MKILFIAPIPPPVAGHSLAAKVFLDDLNLKHQVEIVNLNKNSLKDGEVTIQRIFEIINIFKDVLKKKKNSDVIYFTISESFAGNVKDLVIYFLCLDKLSKMYIHLHGGSLKKLLFDRQRVLLAINSFFLKRLAGAIISGRSHMDIFGNTIHRDRLHIAPNFAQDYLFIDEERIAKKFANLTPLKILFISNMINSKGYNELADMYLSLSVNYKNLVSIDFAGRFESDFDEAEFLKKISGSNYVKYHGVVDDVKKKLLFAEAHIFCLPTAYFEGQPVSILEAYASGCVVITTGQGGIRDIFANGVNGYEVEPKSAHSIQLMIERIVNQPDALLDMAILNRKLANENYRVSTYNSRLRSIVESPAMCTIRE